MFRLLFVFLFAPLFYTPCLGDFVGVDGWVGLRKQVSETCKGRFLIEPSTKVIKRALTDLPNKRFVGGLSFVAIQGLF